MLAGDEPVALDDADGEADEVELARLHGAGVLGHLAADERAAGLPAALGHAFDELLDVVGVEPADGDVVEEEQRLGALAHEVVDAHGDEVDADRVNRPVAWATSALVPTPSVDATSTGLL